MLYLPTLIFIEVLLVTVPVGILYMLAVSSLATYGILLAGWSANSKYAFSGLVLNKYPPLESGFIEFVLLVHITMLLWLNIT